MLWLLEFLFLLMLLIISYMYFESNGFVARVTVPPPPCWTAVLMKYSMMHRLSNLWWREFRERSCRRHVGTPCLCRSQNKQAKHLLFSPWPLKLSYCTWSSSPGKWDAGGESMWGINSFVPLKKKKITKKTLQRPDGVMRSRRLAGSTLLPQLGQI